MPVVILLDVSLSMSRPISVSQEKENGRASTRASLAVAGINTLLDHLSANSRLEFVSLMIFSSLYEGDLPILLSILFIYASNSAFRISNSVFYIKNLIIFK